ncbi:SDR family NAD(P)-dependent oxidoreductase [Ilumatobacter sp.]|uniref:SDR family NAD(P)-dependent oxidoreductase n=1 Tax=Ilumatobacter sp. TaxID=1967498 RepID=UPI003C4E4203
MTDTDPTMTAIVTGAAQGIGRGLAERFTADGWNVVVTDRNPKILDVAGEIGATGHVGDVADAHHVRFVVDATVTAHGSIDVLVNNAGEVEATGTKDPWDGIDAQFDRLFGSNAKGAFLFGRAVAPVMIDGGRGGNIVNISTDHVKPCPDCDRHHGHGSMDLYNAAKWALNGFTFDWAKTLAKHHIRVNNICMGATDTEMLRGYMGSDPDPEYQATWMSTAQIADIVAELIAEGPDGRTANSIGLYAGYPCVMPDPE